MKLKIGPHTISRFDCRNEQIDFCAPHKNLPPSHFNAMISLDENEPASDEDSRFVYNDDSIKMTIFQERSSLQNVPEIHRISRRHFIRKPHRFQGPTNQSEIKVQEIPSETITSRRAYER